MPIIATSFSTAHDLSVEAFKKGAQEFIPKTEISGALLSQLIPLAIERNRTPRRSKDCRECEENFAELTTTAEQQIIESSFLKIELEQSNHELSYLNKTKNKFLGMAAHDLRNPLTVILGYCDMLKNEATGKLNENQENFVNKIYSRSHAMLKMIVNLLDYSAIDAGTLNLNIKKASINSLLHQIHEDQSLIARAKRITLELELGDDIPCVEMDSDHIEQVVNNLISNAIKFSQKGKTIYIRSKKLPENKVQVSIVDQGPGIPQKDAEKIFMDYQKGVNKTTAGESSTGLGLAIVKKFVEAHNGKVWIESVVGEGATFAFSLPIHH